MWRILIALVGLVVSAPAFAQSGITAGAIRWDAWYSNTSSALIGQQGLGPSIYQSRAPIHCPAVSSIAISCSPSQAAMDAEITAAVSGGLKFWAFDQYTSSSSLTPAWNLYQSSSIKNNINWCWITNIGMMGSTGNYATSNAAFVAQFQQSNYQKVTVTSANRPVLFILWADNDLVNYFGGSTANMAAMISDLRSRTVAAGLGTPYIVIQRGSAASAASNMTSVGADAIGAYNTTTSPILNGTFPQLDTQTQAFWATMAATSAPIVPIAMNGFAAMPLIAHPNNFGISTNAQLVSHLGAAVAYINANPAVVPSKLLLIYAWTECEEGGCLTPTIGDPTGSKLAAIKSTIN
jgi:hypothetical protein